MVRLINTHDLSLHEFEGRDVPDYAILSHRWEADEISLQELQGNLNPHKAGWQKVRQFCQYAERKGHQYVWVDTCCIDKKSSAELSEAINSMFKWYHRAEVCYAYLCDVPAKGNLTVSEWMKSFRGSEWFTRGWTLQELLAPDELLFLSRDWEQEIGTHRSLRQEVTAATGISSNVVGYHLILSAGFSSGKRSVDERECSVAQIMSWASHRRTTRVEDMAYSLMGLFKINMPLLYGEGRNAFMRLQLEIMSKYNDYSLFAWETFRPNNHSFDNQALNRSLDLPDRYPWGGLLAPTVQCFKGCNSFLPRPHGNDRPISTSMTNRGLQLEGWFRTYREHGTGDICLLPLKCIRDNNYSHEVGILLKVFHSTAARRLVGRA
ncbi:hypothetical protein PV11_05751 [Exophiala sideris]|uniref:Uncharacterized protein n=1 Tax=Exophiala sideris TaxID=1016849 RepID=A0A0D1X7F0_9EURO|nr:hypothetical protein PV11_05751 [Exophiala sideris]